MQPDRIWLVQNRLRLYLSQLERSPLPESDTNCEHIHGRCELDDDDAYRDYGDGDGDINEGDGGGIEHGECDVHFCSVRGGEDIKVGMEFRDPHRTHIYDFTECSDIGCFIDAVIDVRRADDELSNSDRVQPIR